jgi:hypothetical protein
MGSSLGTVECAKISASRFGPNQPLFTVKKAVDICRHSAKFAASVMKCDTTNKVLTLVLAVLVLADVLFALRTIILQRESRTLQAQLIARQSTMNRLNVVLNESIQYGKTHPEINHVLQPFVAKPPTN